MELIWADESGSKQRKLCKLPCEALRTLLQDLGTSVASENTAFYTIREWFLKQPAPRPSAQQVNESVQLVRIQHCSQLYMASHMCESSLAQQCFSPSELRLACIISDANAAPACYLEAIRDSRDRPLLRKYPAWAAVHTPALALQQLVLDWKFLLSNMRCVVQSSCSRQSCSAAGHPASSSGKDKVCSLFCRLLFTRVAVAAA